MPDLFINAEQQNLRQAQPLAEFVGQRCFLGVGKLLWRMLRLGLVNPFFGRARASQSY